MNDMRGLEMVNPRSFAISSLSMTDIAYSYNPNFKKSKEDKIKQRERNWSKGTRITYIPYEDNKRRDYSQQSTSIDHSNFQRRKTIGTDSPQDSSMKKSVKNKNGNMNPNQTNSKKNLKKSNISKSSTSYLMNPKHFQSTYTVDSDYELKKKPRQKSFTEQYQQKQQQSSSSRNKHGRLKQSKASRTEQKQIKTYNLSQQPFFSESIMLSNQSQFEVEKFNRSLEKQRLAQEEDERFLKAYLERRRKFKKFRIAMLRYRMVVGFWKLVKKAILKKKQIQRDGFQMELHDAIPSCMEFVHECTSNAMLNLFNQQQMLTYYLLSPKREEYKSRLQKLKQCVLGIVQGISHNFRRSIDGKAIPFLKLLATRTNQFDFPPLKFWPDFILKRVPYSYFGGLGELNKAQRQMIMLLFLFTYGLFNRLVFPWVTYKIEETDAISKNSQLVLSVIFYSLFDYLKERNPILENGFQSNTKEYQELKRTMPLIAYKDLVSIELQESLQADRNQEEEFKIMYEQQAENEEIIAGISSRKVLVQILEEDTQFKVQMKSHFDTISDELLIQVDQLNRNAKIFLFSLF